MQIINGIAEFGQHKGSLQSDHLAVTFSGNVVAAVAVLTGFKAKFSPIDGDHHLGLLDVTLNIKQISGPTVDVGIEYGLRDWSGEFDDRYEGVINFAVLAETV
jgi:hypothetical protein